MRAGHPRLRVASSLAWVILKSSSFHMTASLTNHAATLGLLKQGLSGLERATELSACGFVDNLHPSRGLIGWIADPTSVGQPLEVRLCLDNEPVATTVVHLPRPDIWKDRSGDRPAGFVFELPDLLKAAARQDISPTAVLRVRPDGSDCWLQSAGEWIFADIQALTAPRLEVDYVEGQIGPLSSELRRLARQAFLQLNQPLRPKPKLHSGVIEYAARLTPSMLLVGGWMLGQLPTLCALLVEGVGPRRAGSMCVVNSKRADLAPDARAFAGVMYVVDGIDATDLGKQTRIHFAGAQLDWLLPVDPLRRPSLAEAMEEAQALLEKSSSTAVREIRSLIQTSLPWTLGAQRSRDLGVKMGVDKCFIAPGFGLFISGWLLHPTSRPVNIQAKLGGAYFSLDGDSLMVSARPDLAGPFPQLADRVSRAGFSAVLRGGVDPDCLDPWLLRFEFGDGTVYLHELSPEFTRRIDTEFDFHRLSVVSPGFEWAPWLRDLVESIAFKGERDAANGLQWQSSLVAPTALVCALPASISHQRVALDALRSALSQESGDFGGLIVVLPASLPPGLWASWEAMLKVDGIDMSIAAVRLQPSADAWYALLAVLKACEVSRFGFVGPEVILTPAGMTAICQYLAADDEHLIGLNVQSLHGDESALGCDANAFCWTLPALAAHRASAAMLLPGFWRMQGLPTPSTFTGSDEQVHAMRLTPANRDPLRETVNNRLMREAAQQARSRRSGGESGKPVQP